MSKSSFPDKIGRTFSGLFKTIKYSIIFFLSIFLISLILPYFFPSLNSLISIIWLLLVVLLFYTCINLIDSIYQKQTLSEYPTEYKYNNLFNELRTTVIFIFIIYVIFLVLYLIPLFTPILDWINFIQPLSNTFGWFSLIEGMTLIILMVFFHRKKVKLVE